jgi:cyclophilin family peptidyl-prolyl cis-trans isomerase/HEAT repeat protein
VPAHIPSSGLAVALLACATPPAPVATDVNSTLARIAGYEDARSLGAGYLEAQARSPSEAIRARTVLALGRLQRVETSRILQLALGDASVEVRVEAAFALGQLGLAWEGLPDEKAKEIEGILIQAIEAEKDVGVRTAILEALGKTGGERALCWLPQAIGAGTSPERAAAATAAGIIAYRTQAKLWDSSVEAPLAKAAEDPDPVVRFAATYAAMRATRFDIPARPAAVAILRDRLEKMDPDPDTLANAARGLAEVAKGDDFALIAKLKAAEPERVAAEAARGLAEASARCKSGPCSANEALDSFLLRPMAAIAVFNEPILNETFAKLSGYLISREAGVAECYAALAKDRTARRILFLTKCGGPSYPDRKRRIFMARAMSEGDAPFVDRLSIATELARSSDAAVRSASVDALVADGSEKAKTVVRMLLDDADSIVASSAADGAMKLKDASDCEAIVAILGRIDSGDVEAIQTTLGAIGGLKCANTKMEGFLDSPNFSVRLAAAKATESLSGKRPEIPEVFEKPGPYAALVLPPRPKLRIATTKGDIDVELFVDDAPNTARNFVFLTRKKFYDGLTFHRVVPDFVIQGGDPRGDGSGGPGYSIRCEINRHHYLPGTVGMALSGKDTGGSQFFITTSRQPHLDGRYTAFGQVVRGQEVVDSIREGDEIVRVVELP